MTDSILYNQLITYITTTSEPCFDMNIFIDYINRGVDLSLNNLYLSLDILQAHN